MRDRITDVGRNLAGSLERVLWALPGRPQRPQLVAREMGMTADFACRLLKALQVTDHLATLHLIPGPEPLRRAMSKVREKVDPALLARAEEAIARFEELIQSESGDRGALDVMISAWLPEVQEKVELLSKQAVFRGMSMLHGIVGEAAVVCRLFYPGAAHPDGTPMADDVVVGLQLGHRRIRAGAPLGLDLHRDPSGRTRNLTLDGRPVDDLHQVVLAEFSSRPTPRFHAIDHGTFTAYNVASEQVGTRGAVDIVSAVRRPGVVRRCAPTPAEAAVRMSMYNDHPVRRLVFDVLLHEDLFPGSDPELVIARVTPRSNSHTEAPRADETLHMHESVTALGRGLEPCRHAAVPNYVEILRHVCERTGWDPDRFRGYRVDVEYPLPTARYELVFTRPVLAPGA